MKKLNGKLKNGYETNKGKKRKITIKGKEKKERRKFRMKITIRG